jgi:GNAT superfamily N-acetyltransferase
MLDHIVIRPMTEDLILWRCLHSGPLSRVNLDQPAPNPQVPWEQIRARNLPLLTRLTRLYGSCAMLAWDGDRVVGFLRFYPRVVAEVPLAGGLCLQQLSPNGPSGDLAEAELPPFEALTDRTLAVHCLMTGSPQQAENPYQRVGLGGRLVQALVAWATDYGWTAIEATAYQDLEAIYQITGQAGRRFWERQGFEVVDTLRMRPQDLEGGFGDLLRSQAAEAGLDPEQATLQFAMRRELARAR